MYLPTVTPEPDPDPLSCGMDARTRIRIKMSGIQNADDNCAQYAPSYPHSFPLTPNSLNPPYALTPPSFLTHSKPYLLLLLLLPRYDASIPYLLTILPRSPFTHPQAFTHHLSSKKDVM